jgi:fructose-bisphosphate aldolase class 1
MAHIETLRKGYHQQICRHLLFVDSQGIPSNADKSSSLSTRIARAWLEQLTYPTVQATINGQTSGKRFEELTAQFLQESFEQLQRKATRTVRFSMPASHVNGQSAAIGHKTLVQKH